ncbi:hypothetical protein [Bradyrhizobium ottawaense]|uniref:hypothetical protein n=1 Tax=Bradyrhizobium ottawaense TaxID=931866 RepID=UPI003850CD2B
MAPRIGMSVRTVERWLAAGGEPERRRPPAHSVLIDPFRDYLEKRWEEADLSDFCRTKLAFICFPGPAGTCTLLPSGPAVCNAPRGDFA